MIKKVKSCLFGARTLRPSILRRSILHPKSLRPKETLRPMIGKYCRMTRLFSFRELHQKTSLYTGNGTSLFFAWLLHIDFAHPNAFRPIMYAVGFVLRIKTDRWPPFQTVAEHKTSFSLSTRFGGRLPLRTN